MKKYFFGLLIFTAVNSANAESILQNYYSVVSNEFDQNVKAGTCQLKGKAVDMNGNAIAGATISNLNRSRSCVTDAKGNYSLLLSTIDTSIFFYHENYGEIVIWKFEFKSQHLVQIDFYSMEHSDYPVNVEKPVIYLYSDVETDVEIVLDHSALSFTYPKYNDGWKIRTGNDGNIIDQSSGKNYPYLFWEGNSTSLKYISDNNTVRGFLINTDSTVSFLEASLTKMGLNEKEQTDFITYWAPRMINQDFAFVQFLVDEDYDQNVAGLSVTPKPDSQRRIYMLFTPLDQPSIFFNYQAQNLPAFSRNGLTLIEWGGSELQYLPQIP